MGESRCHVTKDDVILGVGYILDNLRALPKGVTVNRARHKCWIRYHAKIYCKPLNESIGIKQNRFKNFKYRY